MRFHSVRSQLTLRGMLFLGERPNLRHLPLHLYVVISAAVRVKTPAILAPITTAHSESLSTHTERGCRQSHESSSTHLQPPASTGLRHFQHFSAGQWKYIAGVYQEDISTCQYTAYDIQQGCSLNINLHLIVNPCLLLQAIC